MNEFDKMDAEEIEEYLNREKPSLEKARDIYSHEANEEMRPEVMTAAGEYMASLEAPTKKPKAAPKKKG